MTIFYKGQALTMAQDPVTALRQLMADMAVAVFNSYPERMK